jgi:PAS domain-containing protein
VTDQQAFGARLRLIEDELEIRRVILAYGPAADAGMAELASSLWCEDGTYDWDAAGSPHEGSAAVEAMLGSEAHLALIGRGAAHFAGPPLIELDGDRANALTYSLIMRREPDDGRYFLWRVSAVRWDLERAGGRWKVRCRTNRLLDDTGGGMALFGDALQAMFPGGEA